LENIIEELIGKERFSYEGEKVRKDGRRFPAEVLLTLIKDKNSTQGDRKWSGKEP